MIKISTLIGLFLLVLTACAGSVTVPADHYYRLSLPAPGQGQGVVLPGITAVERFLAEGELAGRTLLYADALQSQEIFRYRRHFWEQPLGILLQGELVRYLEASGAAAGVVSSDWRVKADYSITARIRRFEHLTAPPSRVLIELAVGVQDTKDRQLIFHKSYQQETRLSHDGVDGAVTAFSTGVAAIFEALVQDLRHLKLK